MVEPATLLIEIVLLTINGTCQADLLMAIVKNELLPKSIAPLIRVITILNTVFVSRYAKTRLIGDNPFNNNCIKKNFKSYDFNLINLCCNRFLTSILEGQRQRYIFFEDK